MVGRGYSRERHRFGRSIAKANLCVVASPCLTCSQWFINSGRLGSRAWCQTSESTERTLVAMDSSNAISRLGPLPLQRMSRAAALRWVSAPRPLRIDGPRARPTGCPALCPLPQSPPLTPSRPGRCKRLVDSDLCPHAPRPGQARVLGPGPPAGRSSSYSESSGSSRRLVTRFAAE